MLERDDVTVLTGWAEAVAEAAAYGPERAADVMADAGPDTPWRAALMLPRPSGRLGDALESMRHFVAANGASTYDTMLAAAGEQPQSEQPLDRMVRRVLLSMLEERQTRRGVPDQREVSRNSIPQKGELHE